MHCDDSLEYDSIFLNDGQDCSCSVLSYGLILSYRWLIDDRTVIV